MKIKSRKKDKGTLPSRIGDITVIIDPRTFESLAMVKVTIPWTILELHIGNGNKIDISIVKSFLETHLKIEK